MGLFDGRMSLPRIERLDLRPLRRAEEAAAPREARACVDCGRATRAGQLCVRCQIVDQVARSLGVSREDIWRSIQDRSPQLLDLLLDECERLALLQRALEAAAAAGRTPIAAT